MLEFRESLGLVKEFTIAFGQEWYEGYTVPSEKTSLIRISLIGEEISELVMAMANDNKVEQLDALLDIEYVIAGTYGAYGVQGDSKCLTCVPVIQLKSPLAYVYSLSGFLDKLIQLTCESCENKQRVDGLMAMNLDYGINTLMRLYTALDLAQYREEGFRMVHASNMSKLDDDGKPVKNAAGRALKGPNYWAPDLKSIVEGK